MVQINGKYQLVKNENFVEHLVASGLNSEHAKAADAARSTTEITQDGNKITFLLHTKEGDHTSILVLNEEIEENLPFNISFLSTTTLNGNVLTVRSKDKAGKTGARVYTFTDSGFVIDISNDDPAIPSAKRFYNRV